MSKKTWTVMGLVDASYVIGKFEAESGEEAAELALREAYSPRICHQCSSKLDIGDVYDVRAWTDDDDSYEGEEGKRKAEIEERSA